MDNLFFGYKIWEDEAYVPKEIENAEKLDLIITIRGIKYTIDLK